MNEARQATGPAADARRLPRHGRRVRLGALATLARLVLMQARFVNIERAALRKLKQLDLARTLDDMRAPPAYRLEPLHGDRAGTYGVRINAQWRLCFRWQDGDAFDVEIVDHH